MYVISLLWNETLPTFEIDDGCLVKAGPPIIMNRNSRKSRHGTYYICTFAANILQS